MKRIRIPALVSVLLAAAVASASMAVLHAAEEHRPRVGGMSELSYFPNGQLVRLLAPGHAPVCADAAWFQTVQYYGRHRKGDQDFHMLRHMASVISDLDPQFLGASRFAGFCLAQEGGDYEGGMAILKESLALNPDRWEPWFDAGFLCFVARRDYPRATFYMQHAASMPGCPEYVQRLAGWVAGKAGYTETAANFWLEIYNHTDNPVMRDVARKYLERLQREGRL